MTNDRQLVAELNQVRQAWYEKIRPRRDSAAWPLADLLIRQPVIEAAAVAQELELSAANALRPIAPLVEAGVLTEFTGGKRSPMWRAREVLNALDAFAARAGLRNLG